MTLAKTCCVFDVGAGERRGIRVFVGTTSGKGLPVILAPPVRLDRTARRSPAGRIILPVGATQTITIPLISEPVAVDTPANVIINSNPSVATVLNAVTIAAGKDSGAPSRSRRSPRVKPRSCSRPAARVRALNVFVGTPSVGEIPRCSRLLWA